jgi:hypothetical protein
MKAVDERNLNCAKGAGRNLEAGKRNWFPWKKKLSRDLGLGADANLICSSLPLLHHFFESSETPLRASKSTSHSKEHDRTR